METPHATHGPTKCALSNTDTYIDLAIKKAHLSSSAHAPRKKRLNILNKSIAI